MKSARPKLSQKSQSEQFMQVAKELGADEDEAVFKAKLAVIARQKPKEAPVHKPRKISLMAKIAFNRGDIVEVDLQGAVGNEKQNDRISGSRPCIIIQNDRGNAVSPLTIVAPLNAMSQAKNLPVQVTVTAAELGAGGKDSVVECGHVRSIDSDTRIKKHLGTLSTDAMKRVDAALKVSLGLSKG